MNRKKSNGKRLLCTSRMLTAMIVLSVFTVGIGIAPVSAQLASVTRDYNSIAVKPNEEFDVTLTQTNFFWGVGTVTEKLPEGFTYIIGSYTGGGSEYEVTYDNVTRELTAKKAFVNETDDVLDSVTYRVKASPTERAAEFAGTFKTFVFIDGDSVKVEGDVSGKKRIGVDETKPYTEDYSPANGATGVSVDTNIVVHVKDNYAVDPNSIEMTVDGDTPDPSDISKIPMTVEMDHWLVIYNPPVDFGYGETVFVTITATDYAGNAMPSPDFFSFTTEVPDTTPPYISNVGSSDITTTTATITWATDEDSDSLVKYGTTQGGPYAEEEYNAADVTDHSIGLTGLVADTTYFYVVNSTDPSDNSAQSGENSFDTLEVPDTTPPAQITNLATSNPTTSSIDLTWTAPGDDGTTGTAAEYDIRYLAGTTPITDANWASATQCTGEPAPQAAGSSETFTVTGLAAGTDYCFAIKTADEVPNWSTISNSQSGSTTHTDRWDINEDGVVDDLDLGLLLLHYGEETDPPYPRWDINEDGTVDDLDLGLLLLHYGEEY